MAKKKERFIWECRHFCLDWHDIKELSIQPKECEDYYNGTCLDDGKPCDCKKYKIVEVGGKG